MILRDEINIDIDGLVSNHVLYTNENSTSLVVIFPGGNNNTTRPFLYYLRDYFLNNDYDVLSISYTNLADRGMTQEKQISKMAYAIHKAILQNKDNKAYQNYLFVSRSVGNIIANTIKNDYDFYVSKSIYVSPIPGAVESIQKDPGLIITSTKDEYFEKENIKVFLENSKQQVLVFEGGSHDLESADTLETIDFCKKAVSNVIKFVSNK